MIPYILPEANGASVRPKGPSMAEVVREFKGKNTTIYRLPKGECLLYEPYRLILIKVTQGTELPEDLVVLHEHADHHSIQCTRPMKLEELNEALTRCCKEKGEKMTKQDYVDRFP